jgi:hypothetical protein
VQATLAQYRSEYQSGLLKVTEEVRQFLTDRKVDEETNGNKLVPMIPEWRMSTVRDFINWRATQKPDKTEGGNIAVGDALKAALKRPCGWAEGQLYINWCARTSQAEVLRFWQSYGYDAIPEGL